MVLFTDLLGGLVGSFFIISVLSMLWKDNPIFRIGQQAIIGATMAHYILLNFDAVYKNAIIPITTGQIIFIIPVILGILMYTRLRNDYAWIARYPSTILIGVGTGIMIAGTLRGQVIAQIQATVNDLANNVASGNALLIFNAALILVGVITSISFFLFTREPKGGFGWVVKIGRIFLMFSLGVNFSGEIVWYLAQLIGCLQYVITKVIEGMILNIH
jgi:hypothetical protein